MATSHLGMQFDNDDSVNGQNQAPGPGVWGEKTAAQKASQFIFACRIIDMTGLRSALEIFTRYWRISSPKEVQT